MKAVVRILFMLALSLLLLPASYAGGAGATEAGKDTSAKSASKAKQPEAASKAEAGKPTEAATEVAEPAPASLPAQWERYPQWRPMAATTGTLGLLTVETGDVLPRKGATFSAFVNRFGRMPGSVTITAVGFSVGYGLHDRVTAFLQFEPHRFVHVGGGQQGQLSFNSPLSNPQFGNTMFRRLTPTGRPGYVEDFPFAARNSGDPGEVILGLKVGLLSELRGDPFSFGVRSDFIIPTVTNFTDLINNQVQTGQFNYAVTVSASRTWSDVVTTAFNVGYRFTRDPRSGGVPTMTMADQLRVGAGLLWMPEKRVQIIMESNGLIFVNDATPNNSFGSRDPVDGLLGLRIYGARGVALDIGYRYMANLVNHGDQHGFVFKLGTTLWPVAPPPPNRAPAAACSADPTMVYVGSGDAVTVRVRASDPDGDPLNYSWTATGGSVQGSGAEVRWNSAGTQQGTYTVTARVDDGRGGTASCAVDIRVEPRPNRAPTMTCSADRTTVLVGERARITATANDPDGDTLSYVWRTNGGQIVGSGSSVQLDTSGAQPGSYTVTGRVEDGRGGAADCSVAITVQAPPPPPQASKLNECFFRTNSARVDNVCKRVLDDVALRLQNDPRARVVIVGFADPAERRADQLAARRADAARKYLAEKGIAEARVDVRTAGGQAGAGRQNRRIDVIWVPEGATY
jgi:outer membrane protein OmpA-like peptidoglycan-associated protein